MHVIRQPADPEAIAPLPCTGARARRLTRRLTSFYESYLRAIDLKLSQYSILVHLGDEPQSIGQLAARLEMDRTTLTRGLGPLIEHGWVEAASGEDARQRCYVISDSGARLRERALQHWAKAQLALEEQLGRDFVAGLNHALEQGLERLRPALPEDN